MSKYNKNIKKENNHSNFFFIPVFYILVDMCISNLIKVLFNTDFEEVELKRVFVQGTYVDTNKIKLNNWIINYTKKHTQKSTSTSLIDKEV